MICTNLWVFLYPRSLVDNLPAVASPVLCLLAQSSLIPCRWCFADRFSPFGLRWWLFLQFVWPYQYFLFVLVSRFFSFSSSFNHLWVATSYLEWMKVCLDSKWAPTAGSTWYWRSIGNYLFAILSCRGWVHRFLWKYVHFHHQNLPNFLSASDIPWSSFLQHQAVS